MFKMGSVVNIYRGRTVKIISRVMAALGLAGGLVGLGVPCANAEVIDNIEIKQTGDQAEIQLHFITRIQYKRQSALKNGDIRIYLTLLDIAPDDPRLQWEKKDSPPSDLLPPFTVTYPELDSSLTISFGKNIKYSVRPGKDRRSLSIFTKALPAKKKEPAKPVSVVAPVAAAVTALPVAAAAAVSAKAAVPSPVAPVAIPSEPAVVEGVPPDAQQKTPEQIQQEAQQLFVAASDALQNNQIEPAIEALNKVLNLPPNVLTQSAQELMGEAREKNGEFVKARAEYELYLKLYPKAADAKQVQARIDKLPKEDTTKEQLKTLPSEAAQKAAEEKVQFTGGISQNYYRGVTHTDTFATDGVTSTTSTFSATDQSMLITNVDMTIRKRTQTTDTRFVLREFNRANFLANSRNDNRWNALYFEQGARDRKYLYRLGRQSGTTAGVPGRFDGIAGGYSINPMFRLNAAIGRPVEYVSGSGNLSDEKRFYAGSIDLTRLPDEWSGSAYGIIQYVSGYRGRAGGYRERTAFGLEAHYFQTQRSYMTQVEYDTIYHKVNLATFQGNWTQESGASYYMTLDHRRSPPLALNLTGQFSASAKQVLSSGKITIQELRDNAIALSPISNMLSLGMSRPVSQTLRFATDFRVSNTAGAGDYTTTSLTTGRSIQPGSPGTGNQYALSFQAIGNNLFFENDLGIASASLTKTSTTTGQSLAFTQAQTFRQKWRVDMALQLFNQSSNDGMHQTQVRPSLTLNYRMSDTMNLSAEGGLERYHTRNANSDDKTRRGYFYFGYRWDFR
jgi:chemotaxis protein histidine kinase CheA